MLGLHNFQTANNNISGSLAFPGRKARAPPCLPPMGSDASRPAFGVTFGAPSKSIQVFAHKQFTEIPISAVFPKFPTIITGRLGCLAGQPRIADWGLLWKRKIAENGIINGGGPQVRGSLNATCRILSHTQAGGRCPFLCT